MINPHRREKLALSVYGRIWYNSRMLPENHDYFVRGDDGAEYGPVDLEELREWVRENRAGVGTEVRLDGPAAVWHPWQDFPELVALAAEVRVTCPVPGHPGLVIAPLWRRVAAFALDFTLVFILAMPILLTLALAYTPDFFVHFMVMSSIPPFKAPEVPLQQQVIAQIIYDVLLAFYFAGFHAAHGKSPAKAVFRLRVVDINGQNPGLLKSLVRAVALIFSMNLFFIPFSYAFLNPQRRTLHDFVAGTYVVEA